MSPAVANRLLIVVLAIPVVSFAVHVLVLFDAAVETTPITVVKIIILGAVVAIRDSDLNLGLNVVVRGGSPI